MISQGRGGGWYSELCLLRLLYRLGLFGGFRILNFIYLFLLFFFVFFFVGGGRVWGKSSYFLGHWPFVGFFAGFTFKTDYFFFFFFFGGGGGGWGGWSIKILGIFVGLYESGLEPSVELKVDFI